MPFGKHIIHQVEKPWWIPSCRTSRLTVCLVIEVIPVEIAPFLAAALPVDLQRSLQMLIIADYGYAPLDCHG